MAFNCNDSDAISRVYFALANRLYQKTMKSIAAARSAAKQARIFANTAPELAAANHEDVAAAVSSGSAATTAQQADARLEELKVDETYYNNIINSNSMSDMPFFYSEDLLRACQNVGLSLIEIAPGGVFSIGPMVVFSYYCIQVYQPRSDLTYSHYHDISLFIFITTCNISSV